MKVLDKQHYVIFSISYESESEEGMPLVKISGYFINPGSILVLNAGKGEKDLSDCIPKKATDWRQKAEIMVADIKPVF